MKKQKRCMALAAALTMSLAISSTALAAVPSDIGGHWAQGTIIQWTSKGYISGYEDGTFKPDNSITRAEFVRLVNQSMGYTKTGNAYFSDVSSSYWGYNDIQKGVAAGYVRGDGNGKFRPNDPVSRQEAAVMISQICGLGQDFSAAAKYTDYRYIPSWAAGYVGAVSKAGIMSGYPDGDFKGDRYLSRAEAVIALDKALNYNASTTDDREVLKNYKLTDTSLKDKIIQGDLTISSSLSKKDVVLDNVKVEGSIIVEGGKTITAKNCEINNLEMSASDAVFSSTGKTTVKKTTFEKYGKLTGSGYTKVVIDEDFSSYVTLDAEIEEVELDEETNVKLLSDCVIDSFTATKNADNATINFNSAKVKNMYLYDAVRITGKGDIRNMTVYESGVKSSIKPDDLTTKNGASKPTYTENSSGDITWGGSSRYDDLTASKDNKTYRGGKYDDVKVTGYNVTLDDMTIYGDLTIDDDVRDGSVDLEDVTIKGNVYIEGGGENSVTFEDCEIDGNIYIRKSYGSKPVAVKFDKYTASHIDGKVVISENGAIIKESGALIDNIEVKTADKVVIGTDVKNLDVMTKTSNLTINSGSDITKLTVSTNAKDSKITINGKVKELYTNVDITVNGSGTVEKTSGSGTVNGISVTGVKLNKTELSLEKGQTETLTATIEPSTATNKSLSWSSNKESVATVDSNGKVTAVAPGEATITVKADGGKEASCKVTVTSNAAENVKVNSITINGSSNMTVNGEQTLTATVKPDDASNKTVTWSSSNTEMATVDQNTGKVTALKEGKVTITATAADGSNVEGKLVITVTEAVKPVTGIEITSDTESFEVQLGGSLKLSATVSPDEATDKSVTWSSSNKQVATMNQDGTVNVLSPGKTIITATAKDGSGAKAEQEITVTKAVNPVESIEITSNTGKFEVQLGESLTLSATVSPDEATDKSVTWSSSNKQVATMNQDGTVNLKKAGTTTITAASQDGSNVNGTIELTVTAPEKKIESIEITSSTNSNTVKLGDTVTLTAKITPGDAYKQDLIWSSSNKQVATMNQDGTVNLKKAGTTTITAASQDGSNVNGTIELTVTAPEKKIESIEITSSTNSNTVKLGDTVTLTAKITPSDAYKQNLIWSSSNRDVATMKQDGTVNLKKAGTTIITAASQDGSGVNGTFQLTVQENDTTTLESAKAELTALLSKYAVKDQNTLTTSYVTMLPVVEKAEDFTTLAPGAMYVEKANVAAFNTAINNAYNVLSNPNSDITAIENAKTAFNNAVSTLVKTTPGAVTLL